MQPVEERRVHFGNEDKADDVDRLRVPKGNRLKVRLLDNDKLPFGELPVFDELIAFEILLVAWSVPLLLDRRQRLAVKNAESDALA